MITITIELELQSLLIAKAQLVAETVSSRCSISTATPKQLF
jgi:hypothetical protein